ncbi:MAG: sigma-54-dependent transcriptional regulator [Bacillota bacterium]
MAKRILVVDDERNMRWALQKALTKEGYLVDLAEDGLAALQRVQVEPPDLVVLDYKMPKMDGIAVLKELKQSSPDLPVIMLTAHGSIDHAVLAVQAGASDYMTKPFELDELKARVIKALQLSRLTQEVSYLRSALGEQHGRTLVGDSPAMQSVMQMVQQVAPTSAPVLITGETGTGKELIARAIHAISPRQDQALIAVNCGALPENLLESELFGYEKGAFTGAVARKPGRLELADGGTLFLDEIGDMPISMQVKLLRVLQEHEFERVGGTQTIKVDFRIVAATHRDLKDRIAKGLFREDLYYRLSVIPIRLPPLRERTADIPLLIKHVISKFSMSGTLPDVSEQAMTALKRYPWPGNIRELENVIERAVILAGSGKVELGHLPQDIAGAKQIISEEFVLPDEGVQLDKVEKSLIRQALARTDGNQTRAASLLGISRPTLIYRMEKYGL